MRQLQPVTYQGRIVAAVVAGQAVILTGISDEAIVQVQARCLYALELADAGRAEDYTDADAEAYAAFALAQRRERRRPSPKKPDHFVAGGSADEHEALSKTLARVRDARLPARDRAGTRDDVGS